MEILYEIGFSDQDFKSLLELVPNLGNMNNDDIRVTGKIESFDIERIQD